MAAPCDSNPLLPIALSFVDSIPVTGATPTTAMDLNDGTWCMSGESRFPPPELDRAVVSTLLVDGERYPASAYRNRVLALVLTVRAATPDALATQMQRMFRQLDKPRNIIRYKPKTSRAVYFRTFRVSAKDVRILKREQNLATIAVDIPAEPFALAAKEFLPTVTISSDPAVNSYFDITGIQGDVETPLVIKRPVVNRGVESLFAVRRRGTPANAPFLLQAEAATQGTDTSTQPNSALFSGSGNNYSRVSFATNTSMTTRLSAGNPWPPTPSVDNRGTYRVFARCRKNGTTGTVLIRLTVGAANAYVIGDPVTVTWTNLAMADLGLMSIPLGADPVHDGYSGVELAARGLYISVEAQRVDGTDTLDIDYLLFVPADDRLAIVHWTDNTGGAADRLVLDAVHEMSYGIVNSSGVLVSMNPGYHVGALPMISPGVTNRIVHINEVALGAAEPSWPASWQFEVWYWPRYIRVAPVAS